MDGDHSSEEAARIKARMWADVEESAWDYNSDDAEDGVLKFEEDGQEAGPRANSLDLELLAPGGGSAAGTARAQRAMFAAHALARWAWRTWEFAVALILMRLYPSSLLMVSVYGLLENAGKLGLGAYVGRYCDRAERLPGGSLMYVCQNWLIVTSAAAAAALVLCQDHLGITLPPPAYWALLVVVVGAGAASSVASLGATCSVEREWVKQLAGGDTSRLAAINSGMRAIDLSCQILAPLASGLLMTYGGMTAAILVIGGYSLAAWVPELLLLRAAVAAAPALREPKPPADSVAARQTPLAALVSGWAAYCRQPTLPAGIALALLYFTVLSLGALMTSFMLTQGLSEAQLSGFRGLGALAGLSATLIFPALHRWAGLRLAGAVGIGWQLVCVAAGALPVVAYRSGLLAPSGLGKDALLYGLLFGICLSRAGLWLFDLAVSQLQQEQCDPGEQGAVGGVQMALSSLLELCNFVLVAAVHDPAHFHWLMLVSVCMVAAAAVTYLAWVASGRGAEGGQRYDRLPQAAG